MMRAEVRPAKYEKVFIGFAVHSWLRHWFSRSLDLIEVHFSPELEARLARSAAQQGRSPDELVWQVVARYFDEESRFVQGVNRGKDALERGEYLTHEQVKQRLERFMQP